VFTVGPCPFRGYITRAVNLSSERIGTRNIEEYKKSACEDLTCDLKNLYVLQYNDIGNV
jgi:hypothetical protein